MTSLLGRRSFMLGLGAVGLGACADGTVSRSFDLGGDSQFAMLNWADYIDVDASDDPFYRGGTLDRFQVETDVLVDYVADYEDNTTGFELIKTKAVAPTPSRYDIVVPTYWRAAEMIANGWAEPLPIEIIPNHVNIDPAFLTNAWDRGSRYQMPWQAGITGIAYDPALTGRPLNSVNDLFDPEFRGRVGFIGEMREAVGLAMLANGDDPSRPTRSTADAGLSRIIDAEASGQIGQFTFENFTDLLRSGELWAAMAWSGDTAGLRQDRPDLQFVVPDEGAIQWFDTMVIPSGSQNMAAAGKFMNFVYEPSNAAQLTQGVRYMSPVTGVREVLLSLGGSAGELARDTVLFPDAAARSRLFTWGGLDQQDEDELDTLFTALTVR